MRNTLLSGAVAALLTAPVMAQNVGGDTGMEQIRREFEELKQKNERLEAEVEYLKEATKAERKERAQDEVQIEKIPALESAAKASDWASRMTWKGDLRYRHEDIDVEEATSVRVRHRLRARFGFTAKVNDTINGVVQIATDGGSSDPRSPNQDLGNGWTRKPLAIDLAYVEWKPFKPLAVQLGKTPMPWIRTGSFFFDGDITPEGIAVKYNQGPVFASAFGYWLSERSSDVDSKLIGGQVGIKRAVGPVTLTGAVSYYDLVHVKDQITTTVSGVCTANPAFFGGPQGNSTYASGGCARLLYDFNDVQVLGQADFAIGKLPMSIFVDYMKNTEADDLDSAWAAGVVLGKASDPHTWEVGYAYQKGEKDSVFGQFHDSDFGGNLLDSKGSSLKVGYAPAKNWVFNGTYHINKRFVDVGTPRDYKRLMLDLNYKF